MFLSREAEILEVQICFQILTLTFPSSVILKKVFKVSELWSLHMENGAGEGV